MVPWTRNLPSFLDSSSRDVDKFRADNLTFLFRIRNATSFLKKRSAALAGRIHIKSIAALGPPGPLRRTEGRDHKDTWVSCLPTALCTSTAAPEESRRRKRAKSFLVPTLALIAAIWSQQRFHAPVPATALQTRSWPSSFFQRRICTSGWN